MALPVYREAPVHRHFWSAPRSISPINLRDRPFNHPVSRWPLQLSREEARAAEMLRSAAQLPQYQEYQAEQRLKHAGPPAHRPPSPDSECAPARDPEPLPRAGYRGAPVLLFGAAPSAPAVALPNSCPETRGLRFPPSATSVVSPKGA